MWGIPHRGSGGAYVQRFIPTYVGHTFHTQKSSNSARGSSPHTWGIQLLGIRLFRGKRFIPTYVGHTQQPVLPELLQPVHPHIRGAYGTSSNTQALPVWFIPTYVGHTKCFIYLKVYKSVHPHIRGAYRGQDIHDDAGFGSSPHTWGIRNLNIAHHGSFRFIPTYVGHTSPVRCRKPAGAVHPHIRGAYVRSSSTRVLNFGSSPPTWGIPPRVR